MSQAISLDRLPLTGLRAAPSQVWGAIRIVPLLRPDAPGDLRIDLRRYDEQLTLVGLDGRDPLRRPDTIYASYVPHALVIRHGDGTSTAPLGAQVYRKDGRVLNAGPFRIRVTHRMVKREKRGQLRLLPMHLAMEHLLGLYFSGPTTKWPEYAPDVLRHGLGLRWESSVPGRALPGLADALRVFELHEDQVGMLLFVQDALAAASVVSHPDDWRVLHPTTLLHLFGEELYLYGLLQHAVQEDRHPRITGDVADLDDLRRALADAREMWAEWHTGQADGLLDRPVDGQRVARFGAFELLRFVTDLDLARENHIGEVIRRDDGTIEYLASYRLASPQTRRAYLLARLARHDWSLAETAAAMRIDRDELVLRVDRAGFGWLFRPHVVEAARRSRGG